jgi:flagellar protein FliS
MYGNLSSPFAGRGQRASMYARVGLETDVHRASPHRLVAMLFDGLFDTMQQAIQAIEAGQIDVKAHALTRAVRIVDEGLKASLNHEAGSLAADLDGLYAFVSMRLTQANLRNDIDAIRECQRSLTPVREAWAAIADSPEANATADQRPAA